MTEMIKGAIFDMDDTLVNSLFFWDILWKRIGEDFLRGKPFCPTDEEDKNMRTMTLFDSMCYLNSIYHITPNDITLADYALDMLGKFYVTDVKLKNGVMDFLAYCKDKNIKMCIASASTREHIRSVLKNLHIDGYFPKIFSCEEFGKGKEAPDIYLAAMEYLGTKKEETCVFEDSITAIKTAKKIGMRTVAIYDEYNYGQEEMKILADEYIAGGETLLKLI